MDNFFAGLQFTDYAKSSTNDITIDVFYLSQTIGGISHFMISTQTIAVFQNDVTKCLAAEDGLK